MKHSRWPIGAALFALAACRTMQGAPESPAIVVHPTPESRAALAQAVSKALGAHVTLEDDALTRDGALTIEESQYRRQDQAMVAGRDRDASGQPERFRLVKIGDRCVLVHERTQRHYDLIGTDCTPR